ncbi:myosin-9-like [Tripterygium wilfordii]|uniref:Myosin-9-like n=2 Tax=Tripterygium wilfordii TaxID=458696 RepID=A0A7J7DRD1_TRIWF|nr:putative leucine-rich repeat-containing protein DDB_G0290503 isoform X2 [Tripterygium wilfordii]KAF5748867.1 myosin-9-like [Tripterygium wilfordii]
MEGDTQVSTKVPVMKDYAGPVEVNNGDLAPIRKEGTKEDEETTLDGEFVKVEKEPVEVKISSEDDKPSVTERSLSGSSRELLEAQEKVKDLELELERVTGVLKNSESENSKLKDVVLLTKDKLEESGKKYEELELGHEKLQGQIIEAEENYKSQLSTLQEALQAQEAKHKELVEVKEAFDSLNLEVESSRKKTQELEQELQRSAGEALKFEELHKQSGSHAESEMQRASEFEKLLEVAKQSTKEKEDQMASLQEEIKGLYEKITENQKVEEALKATATELLTAQEELVVSKTQNLDMEKRLSSNEAAINELKDQLELKKASDSQVKEDMSTLENVLTATKEDLQAKVSELEEMRQKLQEEVNAKELVESGSKAQEAQVSTMQEKLAKIVKEKEALEAAVADLTGNAANLKDLCSDLEDKLKVSNENFSKSDSLLSQALSNNAELEQKLKSLEELHNESGVAAITATQKNTELEELIRTTNEAAEEAKSQLRELETRFIAVEQRNVELEQQLNLVELKSNDAKRDAREFSEKAAELSKALIEIEEEKKLLNDQMKDYQDKITQLESASSQSSSRNSELEEELKIAKEKSAEHEDRASMNHQRSIELEDLFQQSHSKVEYAGKKVNELELLLEAEKYRIQELEEQIISLEKERADAEADSKKYSDRVVELGSELEAFQAKGSSLEVALQIANEKESELTGLLNVATDEKKRFEEALNSSNEKLREAENLLEVLQNDLTMTQENLKNIENDLNAAGFRENEVLEKLKLAEEQLEEQGRVIEQATTRNLELESVHESLTRDTDLKLLEAMENFTNRDTEAKSLFEKLKVREDQVKTYEKQIAEETDRSTSLKEELDSYLMKMASLETANEELKKQILEAENKACNSFSDNELLLETNCQLKSKVDELQELLDLAMSEKEASAQQVASHTNTITELTDKHSRALELHSTAEARIVEAENQLQESIQKFGQRDIEVKDLNEKLDALQSQIKLFEGQATEASVIAESRKIELEETLLKLKNLESTIDELQVKLNHFEKESGGLAEANSKLTEELAIYESKLSDVQAKLSAAHAEKDETVEHLQTSKKTIEELSQQLSTEGQKLQSQISSIMEENNLLSETYQNSNKELQSLIFQLQEQLKEQKANEDALRFELEKHKGEIAEKAVLQTRLKEVEEQLVLGEAQLKDEKESYSQKEVEREAALKKSLDDLEAKNKELVHLEKLVKELEQKLQKADAKLLEKGNGASSNEPKDVVEIKSRDIGSTISTPTKRKSKKRSEVTSVATSSSPGIHGQTEDHSAMTSFKFILAVALVSIIIGVILGKKY